MTTGITGFEPRVDFVVGGVQKGGTTALDAMLRVHPGITMAPNKEVHHFDSDWSSRDGGTEHARYNALWGASLGRLACGESTPIYCWWPPAVERIRDYNPAMKWIVLLRNPADRAYSQWNMNRSNATVGGTFEEALDDEVRMQSERPGYYSRDHSYLSRGLYAGQIERLIGIFSRERILVLRSEWLHGANLERTYSDILAHLGVAPAPTPIEVRSNVGRYEHRMEPGTRAKLVEFFEPDIRRLEALLGWDLSDWLK